MLGSNPSCTSISRESIRSSFLCVFLHVFLSKFRLMICCKKCTETNYKALNILWNLTWMLWEHKGGFVLQRYLHGYIYMLTEALRSWFLLELTDYAFSLLDYGKLRRWRSNYSFTPVLVFVFLWHIMQLFRLLSEYFF